jgi:hypothetical protein
MPNRLSLSLRPFHVFTVASEIRKLVGLRVQVETETFWSTRDREIPVRGASKNLVAAIDNKNISSIARHVPSRDARTLSRW